MRCHIGPHRPRDDVARPRLQVQIDPIRSPGDDTCTTHFSVWSMLSEQLQQCSCDSTPRHSVASHDWCLSC
ncbi:hypothetical protein H9L39_08901 [Fusarium oxysporum f. sp. albedinis]|nr:hypothetical protein H9L39_08901 [Fusarium oxysporum f. sp. albedinis]